jgi:biopolymer transport protein ExbD
MKLTRRGDAPEIPTSSMADIAFLLIIFFMVTAVFSATKGLEFSLPKEENQPPDTETEEAVFIKVIPDGSLSVDCKPMELDGILDYLEPKLERFPDKPVILYTDAYAPYQAMISVYDVLASAEEGRGFKVKNISVPTQTEIREYIEIFGYNPFESECE